MSASPPDEGLRRLLVSSLREVRRFLVCKPSREVDSSSLTLAPPARASLFALGLRYEDYRIKLKKHVGVREAEEIIGWLGLEGVVYPVPGSWAGRLFGGCLEKNTVLELVRADAGGTEPFQLVVPPARYVRSFSELVSAVRGEIRDADEARVYVTSKYAQVGLVRRLLSAVATDNVRVYIAVRARTYSRYGRSMSGGNVYVTHTRSHRKLLLVLYRSSGAWRVFGYHGSMNIFYPATDDYLVAVDNTAVLTAVLHGLFRAFLVV